MTGCVMPASSPRLEQRTASAHHKGVLLREVLKLRNILGASLSVFSCAGEHQFANDVTSIVHGSQFVNTFCKKFQIFLRRKLTH